MTPKIIAYRKTKYDKVFVGQNGQKFERELGPVQYKIGEIILVAKRINTPKSQDQMFEVYPVKLEEAKWSKESRAKGSKWDPRPNTHFPHAFIVKIV